MKVARHGFNPGVGHADQRTAEISIGESNGLEHGARASAVAPFGDATADVLEIHSQRLHNSGFRWKTRKQSTTGDTKLREGLLHLVFLPLCTFVSFVVEAFLTSRT